MMKPTTDPLLAQLSAMLLVMVVMYFFGGDPVRIDTLLLARQANEF